MHGWGKFDAIRSENLESISELKCSDATVMPIIVNNLTMRVLSYFFKSEVSDGD
jgi:hypothetical protein